jgi:replicative DNA helicase
MKPRNENQVKKVKRFEDLLPKFDDGTTDWETAKNRLSQNMSAAEMFLGKMPPQALDIEETVLGACLIDSTAYPKVKEVLAGFATPFYKDAHNVIWAAMSQLAEQNEPIDRHTLWQVVERMQKSNLFLDNPYYLVELTEKVSSSGHVESHARNLLDKCLRRRIMHMSIQMFQKSMDASTDLFDLMDEQKTMFQRFTDFNPILKGIEMPQVMEMAQKATPKSEMMGSLLKKGDVGILFSSAGNGKSIFGIQAADNISKGQSTFSGILKNECGTQIVAYFDLELTLSDYQNRYMDAAGNIYPFANENRFVRIHHKM